MHVKKTCRLSIKINIFLKLWDIWSDFYFLSVLTFCNGNIYFFNDQKSKVKLILVIGGTNS